MTKTKQQTPTTPNAVAMATAIELGLTDGGAVFFAGNPYRFDGVARGRIQLTAVGISGRNSVTPEQAREDLRREQGGKWVRLDGSAPGPGRPTTGVPVHTRLPAEVLAHVDAWADAEGVTRAEAIRRLLAAGLKA